MPKSLLSSTGRWPTPGSGSTGPRRCITATAIRPFEVRLTGHLEHGARVTICIDGSENPEVPPFGGQIDYLTYAGIYRDVWLRVTPPTRIRDVKIETPGACSDQQTVTAAIRLARHSGTIDGTLTARLLSPSGTEVARAGTLRRRRGCHRVSRPCRPAALVTRQPGPACPRPDPDDPRRGGSSRDPLRPARNRLDAARLPSQSRATQADRSQSAPILSLFRLCTGTAQPGTRRRNPETRAWL